MVMIALLVLTAFWDIRAMRTAGTARHETVVYLLIAALAAAALAVRAFTDVNILQALGL